MTKYLANLPDEEWKAFRICAALQGLKIKQAVHQAVLDYIKAHESSQLKIDFKVVEDRKQNLLTFIYEQELKMLIEGVVAAKKHQAPKSHMDELKNRMLEIVKKHPAIPKELAEEVVQTFKALAP
jgi:hypothetical protein